MRKHPAAHEPPGNTTGNSLQAMNVLVRSRDSHHMPPLLPCRLRIQMVTTSHREKPGELAGGIPGGGLTRGEDWNGKREREMKQYILLATYAR